LRDASTKNHKERIKTMRGGQNAADFQINFNGNDNTKSISS
jgi:hypothetical protein